MATTASDEDVAILRASIVLAAGQLLMAAALLRDDHRIPGVAQAFARFSVDLADMAGVKIAADVLASIGL